MDNRKLNVMLGSVLLLLGLIMSGFGIYLILNPGISPEYAQELAAAQKRNCESVLKQTYGVFSGKVTYTVLRPGTEVLQNPGEEIAKASFVIEACEGYELKRFCYGSGCAPPGLELQIGPER